ISARLVGSAVRQLVEIANLDRRRKRTAAVRGLHHQNLVAIVLRSRRGDGRASCVLVDARIFWAILPGRNAGHVVISPDDVQRAVWSSKWLRELVAVAARLEDHRTEAVSRGRRKQVFG